MAIALAAGLAVVTGACAPTREGSPPPPLVEPGGPPVATPLASLTPQIAATANQVRDALAERGLRFDQSIRPYRPSEPPTLTNTPRGLFQTDQPAPDEGYAVIYEFIDSTTAATRGRDLAQYLASGFGQTNYPLDAQFSVGQVGGTLIFTWWSRERASDPVRAQLAFEAIGSVGQPIPVTK